MCLPMASKPPSLSPAYGALVAMMVFWGLSFVATKVALETFPTFTLVFCRFALASCFFLFLLVRKGVLQEIHDKLSLNDIKDASRMAP
jgi:drug/metabolite transporter (DMT)-like permease